MTPDDILHFWFTEHGAKDWFSRNDAFDARFRERFMGQHEAALKGELRRWRDSGEGCLGLCLLLDQFPRNVFRGQPRAFATDGLAVDVASEAIARGLDEGLSVDQRVFLYLPFEHSERMDDQARSVSLMRSLSEGYLDYALQHLDVIARFGRFPHRNATLGRQNTAEEDTYLVQPGAGF